MSASYVVPFRRRPLVNAMDNTQRAMALIAADAKTPAAAFLEVRRRPRGECAPLTLRNSGMIQAACSTRLF